jgi:hypothetical protein
VKEVLSIKCQLPNTKKRAELKIEREKKVMPMFTAASSALFFLSAYLRESTQISKLDGADSERLVCES